MEKSTVPEYWPLPLVRAENLEKEMTDIEIIAHQIYDNANLTRECHGDTDEMLDRDLAFSAILAESMKTAVAALRYRLEFYSKKAKNLPDIMVNVGAPEYNLRDIDGDDTDDESESE